MTSAKIKEQSIAAVRRMHQTIRMPVQNTHGDFLLYEFKVSVFATDRLKAMVRRPESFGVDFTKAELQAVWRELLSRPPETITAEEAEWWAPYGPAHD